MKQIPRNIKKQNGVLQVLAKEAVVCSDWHVPGESKLWYNRLVKFLKDNKIKTLIVGGDFWNFDALSRFTMKDRKMDLSQELDRGLEILFNLTSFTNVYLLRGNHENRLIESLDGSLHFSEWMEGYSIPNLFVTNNDHIFLSSKGEKWRICHPDAYSRIKGNVVSKVAHAKHENVIMGHSHYLSASTDSTGKYICIDSGCMCDQSQFEYKRVATNPFPEWENCFIHIKDGKYRIISEKTF